MENQDETKRLTSKLLSSGTNQMYVLSQRLDNFKKDGMCCVSDSRNEPWRNSGLTVVSQCLTRRHSVASGGTTLACCLQLWERLRAQRNMHGVFRALVSRSHRPQYLSSPRPAACCQDFEDRALALGRWRQCLLVLELTRSVVGSVSIRVESSPP